MCAHHQLPSISQASQCCGRLTYEGVIFPHQHVGSSAFASWASSLKFTWLNELMTNWRLFSHFECPHLKEEKEKESHIALMLGIVF